jgi:hypothetical protein
MSTLAAEPIASPGQELVAHARHVAGLLHQLADATKSSQPGTVYH